MENTNKKQSGFIGWFKYNWAHNSLFSTVFALLVMVLIQCIVMGNIAGSFAGLFPKMRMAWLNILRNNTYAGLIALGMCFVIISGGIDLSVGSQICALGAILLYLIEPNFGLLLKAGLTGPAAAYDYRDPHRLPAGIHQRYIDRCRKTAAVHRYPRYDEDLPLCDPAADQTVHANCPERVQSHRIHEDQRAGDPADHLLDRSGDHHAHHIQKDGFRTSDDRHRLQ